MGILTDKQWEALSDMTKTEGVCDHIVNNNLDHVTLTFWSQDTTSYNLRWSTRDGYEDIDIHRMSDVTDDVIRYLRMMYDKELTLYI